METRDSTIAAFSEAQVVRLTKLQRGRLRYWGRTGFLSPSYLQGPSADVSVRIYTFRDVVALRTLEMLRVQNGVPLQQLRKVAERLSESGVDVWIETTLWVINRRVIFQSPGIGRPQEVVSGQYVMDIPLARIVDDTKRNVVELRRRGRDDIGHVRHLPGVAGGPVVAGTRIRVASIQRLAEDGFSPDRIQAEYPDLSVDDVHAALAYALKSAA